MLLVAVIGNVLVYTWYQVPVYYEAAHWGTARQRMSVALHYGAYPRRETKWHRRTIIASAMPSTAGFVSGVLSCFVSELLYMQRLTGSRFVFCCRKQYLVARSVNNPIAAAAPHVRGWQSAYETNVFANGALDIYRCCFALRLCDDRFSFPDDAVELYAERVAKRGLCAQTQVRTVTAAEPAVLCKVPALPQQRKVVRT